jgi:predicted amidohydrolase
MEVLTTPAARCGIIFAAEGTIPEAARVLTLKGAEVILWAGASAACAPDVFARTRAAENRVTLLCSDAPGEGGGFSMIVDPVGRYLARALPNVDQLITAAVSPAWSANKDVAPGTNTVLGRRPADYAPLVARA